MSRDPQLRLEDILEASLAIESYIQGFSYETFIRDRRTVDAVVRNLEIVGEAVKYLTEEKIDTPIAGLFLLATPYWNGDADWQYDGFALREGFATKLSSIPGIFFYHSRDDETVPFEHQAMYAEKLPQATMREFADRGHQFKNDLSEVVADITKVKQVTDDR